MGQSNSIQEQQEKNQEFQAYINEMNQNMDQRLIALSNDLRGMEDTHYSSFPDRTLLIEGRYSHLTTLSEWSLRSISKIIDSCSKAIFGAIAPNGSQKGGAETSASIRQLQSREAYIANAAFDIVQGIVSSFNNTTSISVERKVASKPIAPGMTLFIGVENNSYSSKQFFRDEKIIQTLFVFRVFYSIKEGVSQSKLTDLQLYEDQKEIYRRKIATFGKLMDNLDPTDPSFAENIIKYENTADIMYQRLEKLNSKIDELLKGGNFRVANVKKSQKAAIAAKEMEDLKQVVKKLKAEKEKVLKKKKK